MKTILIPVIEKIAHSPEEEIVCGNSDYYIEFAFDSEWDGYDVKTARFIYSGKKVDVVFTGNTVQVPVVANTTKLFVGVFSGDLRTSTPAVIVCRPSILCKGGMPADPTPDVYAQILEMMNGGIKQFPLPVSEGGTGATSAEEARKNLGIGSASGSGLPEVTEGENGKTLMVVDGVWELVDHPAGAQFKKENVTIPASSWLDNGSMIHAIYYGFEYSLTGCDVDVSLAESTTKEQFEEAARCGVYCSSASGREVIFTALYAIPTIDLHFNIRITKHTTLAYSVDEESMTLTIVEGDGNE